MTEPSKGERTRQKLVDATAALLQRQGFHATGLSDIVEESGAPRGSVYFHFPGGKDELARVAIEQAGAQWRERIDAVLAAAPDLRSAVAAVCTMLADELERSRYQLGCPVAAVALEAPATSTEVRRAVTAHFASFERAIVERLAPLGITGDAARQIALFTLSAVEGALMLAKVQRSREPLLAVGRMLGTLVAASRG
jgi:TetR/AcrR family transcriptional repressor of lmrAB and yxaGH operons